MADSKDRKDTDEGAASVIETSELAERLVRRATGKVGVVDLHQPQQIYARTAGWVAERFPLIGQLNNRYAVDEQSHSSQLDFAMGRPVMEQMSSFAAPNMHRVSGIKDEGVGAGLVPARIVRSTMTDPLPSAIRAGTSPAPTPSSLISPAPATFRVSRRPPQIALKPDPAVSQVEAPSSAPGKSEAPSAENDSGQHSGSQGVVSTPVDTPMQTLPVAKTESNSPIVTSAASPSLILAKRSERGSPEISKDVSNSNLDVSKSNLDVSKSSSDVSKSNSDVSEREKIATKLNSDVSEREKVATKLNSDASGREKVATKLNSDASGREKIATKLNSDVSGRKKDATKSNLDLAGIKRDSPKINLELSKSNRDTPTINRVVSKTDSGNPIINRDIPEIDKNFSEASRSSLIFARRADQNERGTEPIIHDEPVVNQVNRKSTDSVSLSADASHEKSDSPQAATLPSLTLAAPRSVIQRKAQGEAPASEASSSRVQKELPVAKELIDQLPRQERASVVWRKSEGAGKGSRPDLSTLPGGGMPTVARQTNAASGQASTSQTIPSEAPPAQEQTQNGRSFDEDSEQIIRMLYRRLAVERERRGIE